MQIILIIGIVLFIIVSLIIIKVVKTFAKAMFLISSLVLFILIIVGVITLSDVGDFKKSFSNQTSLYILEKDDIIIAGFNGEFSNNQSPILETDHSLESINGYYINGDISSIKGDHYKLFIIDLISLEIVKTIDTGEVELTFGQVSKLLSSDTPIDDYIKISSDQDLSGFQKNYIKENLMKTSNIEDESQFKGILFGMLFQTATEKQGSFLFKQYKKGNIIVYPETAMFKLVKLVPSFLLDFFVTEQGEKNRNS